MSRQTFENISADTDPFTLPPGRYAIDYKATWGGGNVALERLASDGTTWIAAGSAFSANGQTSLDLAGTYRLNLTTATGVYASVVPLYLY